MTTVFQAIDLAQQEVSVEVGRSRTSEVALRLRTEGCTLAVHLDREAAVLVQEALRDFLLQTQAEVLAEEAAIDAALAAAGGVA